MIKCDIMGGKSDNTQTAQPISADDLARLAQMTRLAVPPNETAAALQALNNILHMMGKLQEADVSGVDALSHVQYFGANMRLRDDTAAAGYPRDALLAAAPQSDGRHFIVPKVIE